MKAGHVQESLRAYPLAERLRSIHRAALGTALGVVALVALISGAAASLIMLVDTNQAAAKVLGDGAGASLAFQDPTAAERLLESLRHSPAIRSATIFGDDGKPFARYGAAALAAPPERMSWRNGRISDGAGLRSTTQSSWMARPWAPSACR